MHLTNAGVQADCVELPLQATNSNHQQVKRQTRDFSSGTESDYSRRLMPSRFKQSPNLGPMETDACTSTSWSGFQSSSSDEHTQDSPYLAELGTTSNSNASQLSQAQLAWPAAPPNTSLNESHHLQWPHASITAPALGQIVDGLRSASWNEWLETSQEITSILAQAHQADQAGYSSEMQADIVNPSDVGTGNNDLQLRVQSMLPAWPARRNLQDVTSFQRAASLGSANDTQASRLSRVIAVNLNTVQIDELQLQRPSDSMFSSESSSSSAGCRRSQCPSLMEQPIASRSVRQQPRSLQDQSFRAKHRRLLKASSADGAHGACKLAAITSIAPSALVAVPVDMQDGVSLEANCSSAFSTTDDVRPVHVILQITTAQTAQSHHQSHGLQLPPGWRFVARAQGQTVPVKSQCIQVGSYRNSGVINQYYNKTPDAWIEQQQRVALLLLAQHAHFTAPPRTNTPPSRGDRTNTTNSAAAHAQRLQSLALAITSGSNNVAAAWRCLDNVLGGSSTNDSKMLESSVWLLTLDISRLKLPCGLQIDLRAGAVILDSQPNILLDTISASLAPDLWELSLCSRASQPDVDGRPRRLSRRSCDSPCSSSQQLNPQPGSGFARYARVKDSAQSLMLIYSRLRLSGMHQRSSTAPLAHLLGLGKGLQTSLSWLRKRARRNSNMPALPSYDVVMADNSAEEVPIKLKTARRSCDGPSKTAADCQPVFIGAASSAARACLWDLCVFVEYMTARKDNHFDDMSPDSHTNHLHDQMFTTSQLDNGNEVPDNLSNALPPSRAGRRSRSLDGYCVRHSIYGDSVNQHPGSRLSISATGTTAQTSWYRSHMAHIGCALLHHAVEAGWPEVATWILTCLVSPSGGCTFTDVKCLHDVTLLARASASGRPSMLKCVIAWGQKYNEPWTWEMQRHVHLQVKAQNYTSLSQSSCQSEAQPPRTTTRNPSASRGPDAYQDDQEDETHGQQQADAERTANRLDNAPTNRYMLFQTEAGSCAENHNTDQTSLIFSTLADWNEQVPSSKQPCRRENAPWSLQKEGDDNGVDLGFVPQIHPHSGLPQGFMLQNHEEASAWEDTGYLSCQECLSSEMKGAAITSASIGDLIKARSSASLSSRELKETISELEDAEGSSVQPPPAATNTDSTVDQSMMQDGLIATDKHACPAGEKSLGNMELTATATAETTVMKETQAATNAETGPDGSLSNQEHVTFPSLGEAVRNATITQQADGFCKVTSEGIFNEVLNDHEDCVAASSSVRNGPTVSDSVDGCLHHKANSTAETTELELKTAKDVSKFVPPDAGTVLMSSWFGFSTPGLEAQFRMYVMEHLAPLARVWAFLVLAMTAIAISKSLTSGQGRGELPALLIWASPYLPLLYATASKHRYSYMPICFLLCHCYRAIMQTLVGLYILDVPQSVSKIMESRLEFLTDPFLYTLVEQIRTPQAVLLRPAYCLSYILLNLRLGLSHVRWYATLVCILSVAMTFALEYRARRSFLCMQSVSGHSQRGIKALQHKSRCTEEDGKSCQTSACQSRA